MAESDGQEKKHDPGGKSLQQALSKGNIARSADLNATVVLVAGTFGFVYFGGYVAEPIMSLTRMLWAHDPHEFDLSVAFEIMHSAFTSAMIASFIPLTVVLVASIIVGLAQTQGNMAWGALEWDWNRFDPISGFQRLFVSMDTLVELGKSLLKLSFLGFVVGRAVYERLQGLPLLATLPPRAFMDEFVQIGWDLVMRAIPAMIVISSVDYGYNAWRRWEDLKRTDQEVKDEAKDAEGSSMVKGKIRQRMRQIIFGNMMSKLKEADVIVTNPTHYAVALRYRRDQDEAPIVLAKGVDFLALKIREEAKRLNIPRVEDRPLARALYAKGKVGRTIPTELYGPVAKVLAIVYRRRQRRPRY